MDASFTVQVAMLTPWLVATIQYPVQCSRD